RQLGDGRHLAQEPQAVEAALVAGGRRPRQLGGPADLALDAFDELADLLGGGGGLFALDADQRGPVLVIGQPDFQEALGQERDANRGQEQCNVFAEQRSAELRPAAELRDARSGKSWAIPHSITSSAMASSDGGKAMPSSRAVEALMTSSNLVPCTTGK